MLIPDMSNSRDEHLRLMRQAAQGDTEAFCVLYKALLPHISRFLVANNGHGSVEDLLQETVGRFWRSKADFRGESTVLTFVLSIAANVIREHEATRQRSPGRTCPPHAVMDYMERESLAVFQDRSEQDSTEWLKKLLATLPPNQREAVDLVYYQKRTTAQAARKTGCSSDSFRSRLCRARKILRAKMTSPDGARPDASSD